MCNSIKFRPSLIVWIGSILIIMSCSDRQDDQRDIPDVPPAEVEIIRMEQLICEPENIQAPSRFMDQYPVFTDVFFNQIIFPQNAASIELDQLVSNFCSAPAIQHLMDTTQAIFPHLDEVEKELGQALGNFGYYFPELPIPEVYTYVSEFGIGTFTIDTRVLGIGLDFFLGSQYPFYDPSVFPNFMVQTMTPEYITSNAIQALSQVLLPPTTTGNLLDYMIYNGKVLYIASRLLPHAPMHQLCLYTPGQMEWVESNELNIWSYFLDLDYFYENDPRKFRKYIDPAPGTPGMPEQAPGRVANWVGYRIVEAYMNRFPEITLSELAAETDFQKIMDQSDYKPPRPKR